MKTRPGIDRLDKQELTVLKGWINGRMKAHMKQCPACTKAGTELRKRCGTWWRLARRLHQVKRALKKYDVPETASMDVLPGMETL